MARLALAGQTYTMRSLAAAAQTCTNLYAEKIEDPNETAKGKAVLFGTPGRHLFKNLTVIDANLTPLRGAWSGAGRVFVAAGARYCEIDSSGALVGSVRTITNPDNSPVQFFVNGAQLMIVGGGSVWVDNGNGPTIISLPTLSGVGNCSTISLFGVHYASLNDAIPSDLFDVGMVGQTITINAVGYTVATVMNPLQLTLTATAGAQSARDWSCTPSMSAVTGAFIDGYFLVNRANSRQINFSDILDGSNGGTYVWNGLDYFTKNGYPDRVRSILANNEQLYVFGEETMEVYQDTGNATTPWQPIQGTMQRYGSASPWGPIAIDGRVFFIGGASGGISAYVLDGFTPKRISTHAIEEQWNAANLGYAAVSYAYMEQGHSFWVIYFGAQTWTYDTTTGAWGERKLYSAGAFVPATTCYHAFVEWPNGTKQHLTGGPGDAKLYDTSVDFYDDNGTDIAWQRALPYVYNDGKRVYFGRGDLEMETGTVASGAEPVVSRDYSDDRGHTFSTPVTAGIGTHNDYSRRVFWPLGGSCGGPGRVWRLSGVGQSKVALIDYNQDITMGTV